MMCARFGNELQCIHISHSIWEHCIFLTYENYFKPINLFTSKAFERCVNHPIVICFPGIYVENETVNKARLVMSKASQADPWE